ncbi:MAG: twin-arginine translocase subunit TatB [Hyphomicrobiales bacterium]|nr:twin-arginine translocase subunit TatB [Hyphomicrobiales bacterium]
MFDIGWSELVLIGVVALIAIGPKELPGALRTLGQWTGKLRRMASEFQSQFHEAMREAEMDDLKKKVDEMTSHSSAGFDPVADVRKELESTQRQIEGAMSGDPAVSTERTAGVATSVEPAPTVPEPAVVPDTPASPAAVGADASGTGGRPA